MSKRARRTLEQVFAHPIPRDIRWKDLIRLCEELGVAVKERRNTATFTFEGRSAGCHRPHGKATDKGAVAAVRDLLRDGGVTPGQEG